MLTQTQYDTLAGTTGKHLISLYIPTTPVGTEEKDRIRLKNALQRAKEHLTERGMNDAQATEYLTKGTNLLRDFSFSESARHGLAVFIGPDFFQTFPTETTIDDTSVTVGDSFRLSTMTKELNGNSGDFFLLTISRQAIKLYAGKDTNLEQIDLTGVVPTNMDEALQLKTPNRQLNRVGRTNANGQGTVHGHGAGKDVENGHLKAYFDEVDQGIATILKNEKRPLLLGGVAELIPIYREANQYNHLIEEHFIKGNCDDTPTSELYEKASGMVAGYLSGQRSRDRELFDLNLAKGEAGTDLKAIVPAAINGRIAVLWVAEDAEQYGTYDQATNGVALTGPDAEGATELFNLATTRAVQSGARVYVDPQLHLPRHDSPICAIYRYAVQTDTTNLEKTGEATEV